MLWLACGIVFGTRAIPHSELGAWAPRLALVLVLASAAGPLTRTAQRVVFEADGIGVEYMIGSVLEHPTVRAIELTPSVLVLFERLRRLRVLWSSGRSMEIELYPSTARNVVSLLLRKCLSSGELELQTNPWGKRALRPMAEALIGSIGALVMGLDFPDLHMDGRFAALSMLLGCLWGGLQYARLSVPNVRVRWDTSRRAFVDAAGNVLEGGPLPRSLREVAQIASRL